MYETQTQQLTPPVNQDDHVQGPANAAVTVVEYGDYECPYCGEVVPWIEQIQRQMGDRMRFVFRNFPLPQHPYAEVAAEAAEAAGAQGKFWQMHDLLYQNQQALEPVHLMRYAQQIGLNTDAFEQALRSHAERPRIQRDVRSGVESDVQGTPTFFINGSQYQGPLSEQAIFQAIKAAGA